MKYFELLELPVSFFTDKKLLKEKFLQFSRKYHPDFFTQSQEDEQMEALEKSALLNKAYKTLSNEDDTIQYILQEKGLLTTDEKYALNQSFLLEVMELNEALLEAKMEDDQTTVESIITQITTLQNNIYTHVKPLLENYQEGSTAQETLLPVKEYYYQKKYLAKIIANATTN